MSWRARRILLIGLPALLVTAPRAFAEFLAQYDLEWVCLRAQLIVEARRVEPGVVEILKVHHGDAKVGDRLTLRRFEDLPQRAYKDVAAAWGMTKQEGTPLDGCTALLFLERAAEGGYEPVGWGSGVKWVVGGRICGHVQPMNPGDYVLVPDGEAETLDGLRGRIAAELKRRSEFESKLVLLKPEDRARALLPYVFRVPRDAYSWAAQETLLQIGERAGDVLAQETGGARTEEQRQLLAELFGRLRYPGGAAFVGSLFDEQMARVRKLPKSPSREEMEPVYRWQSTVYWLSEVAGPSADPRLVAALRWAVAWRQHEIVASSARGLARTHEPGTVPVLAKALRDWPSAGAGQAGDEARAARQSLVQCLGDHRLPACVPVLASVLGDPDPEVADLAHSCLEQIVGEDLGERPEPWLEWLAGLAARK